jgi:hypothetical protein
MDVGTSWTATIWRDYGPGKLSRQYNQNYTVLAKEVVTVPLGKYEAFKLSGSGEIDNNSSTVTYWWAPQIGAPVQIRLTGLDNFGRRLDMTFKLASKTR